MFAHIKLPSGDIYETLRVFLDNGGFVCNATSGAVGKGSAGPRPSHGRWETESDGSCAAFAGWQAGPVRGVGTGANEMVEKSRRGSKTRGCPIPALGQSALR